MVDDPFVDVLTAVCGPLDQEGIVYALTGSIVSGTYGEPFSSQDVDICLRMTAEQAARLASSLPQRFYRSEESMRQAAMTCSMANLIDTQTGLKVDLSVLPNEVFYRSVLARRSKVSYGVGGPSFWMVSPEDIVLMKLIWRKGTKSEKQWENALSVIKTMGQRLDWSYLSEWAEQLGIANDLGELRRQSGI
jgi:hypothetical protein